jgi:hypothetical protein
MPDINGDHNVSVTTNVNVPQPARGAGTVLAIVFLWPALLLWWSLLLCLWIIWMLIAGIGSIFDHSLFARTWYQPWPAWLFGIR